MLLKRIYCIFKIRWMRLFRGLWTLLMVIKKCSYPDEKPINQLYLCLYNKLYAIKTIEMDKEKEYKKLLLDNYKAISRIILTYNKLSNRFPTEFSPLMNELVSKSNDKEYAVKTYDLYKDIL